ncbi:MAG TPA: gluconeogenesis factor YvcK family protein [Candidatus Limnocylindrales bacterium]|nr:gluconeogenesis factor YvcK family protein [Candidatus Limnocylindrales bacterium]
MGLKRWLLVVFAGELLIAFAGSLVLRALYREVAPEGPGANPLLWLLTLSFLPLVLRPIVLLGAGAAIFLFGLWRLLAVILEPFGQREEPLVELIYRERSLARGPRIVAIGGGTGLSTLLRGLKEWSRNITAVVNVADDGGSSGKLRAELGIAPMGDIRRCLAALADSEAVMTRLLQYRFPDEGEGGLGGHAFGNLLIAALTASEGDFEEGVRRSNEVLAVRGQVVPASPLPLTLHARLASGEELVGQSLIARARGVERVWVTPERAPAAREAIDAIAEADIIVLGPGSLYTSLLPSLLLPEIRSALASAGGTRVFVCNVATQVGETEGYTLYDHLMALERHGVSDVIDAVLANDNFGARAPEGYPAAPVRLDLPADAPGIPQLVLTDLVDESDAHHHDPEKLAAAVVALTGEAPPRREPTAAARSA